MYKDELKKLTGEALDKRLQEIHSLSPDYHIHVGASSKDLKGILSDAGFMKRAGPELRALIELRISGRRGIGENIARELEKKFGVKLDSSNLLTSADCHVGQDLGDFVE